MIKQLILISSLTRFCYHLYIVIISEKLLSLSKMIKLLYKGINLYNIDIHHERGIFYIKYFINVYCFWFYLHIKFAQEFLLNRFSKFILLFFKHKQI